MSAKDSATRRQNLLRAVLRSYRGRYILSGLALTLLLLVISMAGKQHVERIRDGQPERIQRRAQASAMQADTSLQLQELHSSIQGFLLDPAADVRAAVEVAYGRLATAVHRLAQAQWLTDNPDTAALVASVVADLEPLADAIRELLRIRLHHESWFPAMRTLQDDMYPRNQEVRSLADDILYEAQQQPDADIQAALLDAAMSLRLGWTDLTLEFRLLVANRLGVFASDARAGMSARASNMRLHAEQVRAALVRLQALDRQHALGLLTQAALPRLDALLAEWLRAFEQTHAILLDDDWRQDLRYLRDRVRPKLEHIDQTLSALDLELGTQSAQDIALLTRSAAALSNAVVVLAAGVMFIIVAGYLTFSRAVLGPVFATTRALKQEALGQRVLTPPAASASELCELVEAFEAMRRQVHERQAHLDHLAHHDALTNLPNRVLFRDRVEHALQLAERRGSHLGVLFMDLDRFKQVNDSLGHAVGDALLVDVAARLRELVRRSDTVARLSGDEFALLAEAVHTRGELAALAEKIVVELGRPFRIGHHELHLSASLGIVVGPDDGATPDELLRGADAAMYEAKRHGRAAYRFFSAEMTRRASEFLALETAIRTAVEARQFRVHYQPVYAAAGGPPVFYEALLRWARPDGVLAPPAEFLSTLDDTGLIQPVTEWLMRQVWAVLQQLPPPTRVAVNLSARVLQDGRFAAGLLRQLEAGPLPADRLILEVTEDSLSHELSAVASTLNALKARGVHIALDDFGTGQSSLSHLRHFAFDLLKIDREFVRGVVHDERDAALVRATIRLAQAFGLPAVAEGVETQAQLDFLRREGCDLVQGFLLGRPAPADALPGGAPA